MLQNRSHLVPVDPSEALAIIEGKRMDLYISVSMLTLIVYNAC